MSRASPLERFQRGRFCFRSATPAQRHLRIRCDTSPAAPLAKGNHAVSRSFAPIESHTTRLNQTFLARTWRWSRA